MILDEGLAGIAGEVGATPRAPQPGQHGDHKRWLEGLAPFDPSPARI